MPATPRTAPVHVRRYGRSRLYDATHGSNVTLERLRGWTAAGITFMVVDAETGADVTRVLLA